MHLVQEHVREMELRVKSPVNLNNLLHKCRNSFIIESALNQSAMYTTGRLLKKTAVSHGGLTLFYTGQTEPTTSVLTACTQRKNKTSHVFMTNTKFLLGATHLGPRDKVALSLMLTFQRDGPKAPQIDSLGM